MSDGTPSPTSTVAEKAKDVYAAHGEKLRYVVVGVWNTLFNGALFALIVRLFGHELYLVWFWVAWTVSVVQSTATMRFFVFHGTGNLARQVGRAYFIYLPAQGLSTLILWAGVQFAHLPVPIAWIGAMFVTTICSYFGHKYFTFRVPLEVGEVAPEDMMNGSAPAD